MNTRPADLTVLVVDDLEVMRRGIAKHLTDHGFAKVDTAESAEEALAKQSAQGGYDLIVSDWDMDTMTGLDLLKAVRRDAPDPDLAFILTTAEVTEEKRQAADAAGVSGFLAKPFSGGALRALVDDVLARGRNGGSDMG